MDKKYSFANVTVRNYNSKFERKLSAEFREMQNQFANSKSQFYLYLASLGMEVHEKRKLKSKEPIKDVVIDNGEILDLLNCLIEYIKDEKELTMMHLRVSLLMSSAILGVLTDIADGSEVEIEDIEHGLYDKIPERFLRVLKQTKGSK